MKSLPSRPRKEGTPQEQEAPVTLDRLFTPYGCSLFWRKTWKWSLPFLLCLSLWDIFSRVIPTIQPPGWHIPSSHQVAAAWGHLLSDPHDIHHSYEFRNDAGLIINLYCAAEHIYMNQCLNVTGLSNGQRLFVTYFGYEDYVNHMRYVILSARTPNFVALPLGNQLRDLNGDWAVHYRWKKEPLVMLSVVWLQIVIILLLTSATYWLWVAGRRTLPSHFRRNR